MRYMMTFLAVAMLCGCTQEAQNQLGQKIQNWTGTDGVMEIYLYRGAAGAAFYQGGQIIHSLRHFR